jgi:hypothetical protein
MDAEGSSRWLVEYCIAVNCIMKLQILDSELQYSILHIVITVGQSNANST